MKKRMLAMLLGTVMVVTSLAGCGSDSGKESSKDAEASKSSTSSVAESTAVSEEKSSEPEVPEEIPVDYFAGTELSVAVFRESGDESKSYEEKEAVKLAEEATGIKINWIEIESSVSSERVSAMLSSGELPDVMLNLVDGNTFAANTSLFYDLTDLLETYAPAVLSDYELGEQGVLGSLTLPDGSIRSLACNTGVSLISDPGDYWWINQNWLDQLDMEIPTTADEFYEVLCAFRDNDMNGDGDPNDEIPLSFIGMEGFYNFANSFGIGEGSGGSTAYYYHYKDGKVSPVMDTDEYRDFLEYYHKLASEGLLDVEGFSQSAEQFQAKAAANKLGVFVYFNPKTAKAGVPEDYAPMIPFQALENVPAVKTGASNTCRANLTGFVVSAESDKAEAALHWWNYLSDDPELSALARAGHFYYSEEDNGKIRQGWSPEEIAAGVDHTNLALTLGMCGGGSPYLSPHEFGTTLKTTNVRYPIYFDLVPMMSQAADLDDTLQFGLVDADFAMERTLLETDLVALVDGFTASSVVDGVTDASWGKFCKDLETYQYYEYLDWLQEYADSKK